MIQLYDYQKASADVLERALHQYNYVLDGSDTGTGKTYTALEIARRHAWRFLIVCPKAVTSKWAKTASDFGLRPEGVVNIEKLKTGKTPWLRKVGKRDWRWLLDPGDLILWDEVHNASGYRSQNGKILATTKPYRIKVVMSSATAADSPLKLRAIGYLLGLHNFKDHYSWCLAHGCRDNIWGGIQFTTGPRRLTYMKEIHDLIFPSKGNRVRIRDLDVFPENAIFADAYDLGEYTSEINAIYDEMEAELKEAATTPLTIMLRARQRTELFKVPLLTDMTKEILEEEKSAVLFVNFRETLDMLREEFPMASCIFGGQKESDRSEAVRRFLNDKERVCICMIQAGGVGIDLDDKIGNYPRASLISPGFNAVEMRQALGRIHRAGTKTKCIQKIVYAAETIEEKACAATKRKLANMDMLNDGDMI